MKNIKIIFGIMIVLILAQTGSASFLDDIGQGLNKLVYGRSTESARSENNILPLTITSYAGSVPVQIGYNTVSKYWILTTAVGCCGLDQLTLIKLPGGTVDNGYVAQKETSIQIKPVGAYSTAPLTKSYAQWGFDYNSEIYFVEGGAWKTTTMYDIYMDKWYYIDLSYDKPAQVNLYGGAYVNNLGILSNGVNIPSGSFVIAILPNGIPHIYDRDRLQTSINYWASHRPFKLWGTYSYQEIYDWLTAKGMWPSDIVLTQNPSLATKVYYDCGAGKYYTDCYTNQGEVYKYVKVKYPMTGMSSFVSLYIPGSLADTINVVIPASKAVIVGTPVITRTKEGAYATLSVTVKNDGGKDYISVKPTSSYYSFTAIGDNSKLLNTGDSYTFTFQAYALDVTSVGTSALINILADGTDPYNGDSTTEIYGIIDDNPVFPPYTGTPTPSVTPPKNGQPEDLTWVFWGFLFAVGIIGFLFTKNPLFLVFVLLIGVLYIGVVFLERVNVLVDKLNPFNWFK